LFFEAQPKLYWALAGCWIGGSDLVQGIADSAFAGGLAVGSAVKWELGTDAVSKVIAQYLH
jgi:hypothetical protein